MITKEELNELVPADIGVELRFSMYWVLDVYTIPEESGTQILLARNEITKEEECSLESITKAVTYSIKLIRRQQEIGPL